MPLIIAVIIRYVIMAAVQLGLWKYIEKYFLPAFNEGMIKLMDAYGLTREQAEDVMANEVIIALEEVGFFAVTLKTKLPIKVAEVLGFTSKGYALRNLAPLVKAKIASSTIAKLPKVVATVEEAGKVAEVVAKTRGSTLSAVNNIVTIILKVLAVPVGVGLVITNTIDFGAWPSSAYQGSIQKFLAIFGLKPDAEAKNSKVLSETVWNKIYAVYQNMGAIGIQNPYLDHDQAFTRDNLIALVDKVASQIITDGGKATFQTVLGATQGFIVMKEPVTDEKINNAFSGVAVAPADAKATVSVAPITKVFTGIVSQGVVGAGLVFTPRPDDMIESVEELRSAASNNLAPYLQALTGKIVYEVKIVSSVISKDGFRQTGTTQRIQTGTYKNGTPKYKTVTNKFATLVVYALTDKGSRAKLTTIVLGPTNSAKLTVGQNDLQALQDQLPALVTTTDIKEITNIQEPTPVAIVAPTPQVVAEAPVMETYLLRFYNSQADGSNSSINGEAATKKNGVWVRDRDGAVMNKTTGVFSAPAPATTPSVSASSTTGNKPGANATTLYEWYQAQGRELPSVAERSVVYFHLNLGVQGYYTGTAEQNTKLLAALKYQAS